MIRKAEGGTQSFVHAHLNPTANCPVLWPSEVPLEQMVIGSLTWHNPHGNLGEHLMKIPVPATEPPEGAERAASNSASNQAALLGGSLSHCADEIGDTGKVPWLRVAAPNVAGRTGKP